MSARKTSSDGGGSRCSVLEREAESLERERERSGSLRGRRKSGSRGRETNPVVFRHRNRNSPGQALVRSNSGRVRRRSAPPDTYNTNNTKVEADINNRNMQ